MSAPDGASLARVLATPRGATCSAASRRALSRLSDGTTIPTAATTDPSGPATGTAIEHAPSAHNRDYLRAKKDRLGHLLHHQGLALDEEMIHQERIQDRERAAADEADLYGQGPAPRRTGE